MSCGSSFSIAAAAIAPIGQLHLFFPPKEVPRNLGARAASLRSDTAFQTTFFRRNTVPLTYDGRPLPEYEPKLSAMLAEIDAGRRPSAAVSWSGRMEPWME